jgi:hypothetical protein
VGGRVLPDRDPDEGRLERQRDERTDREAEALAVDFRGDDGHGRRETPHHLPQLLAGHGSMIGR